MELLIKQNDADTWVDRVERDLFLNRKIYLNEYISPYTFNNIIPFIDYINMLDKDKDQSEIKPIELIINSGGGSFHDGIALITAIKRSKTPIHGYVYSYAYSMALAIFESCDKRFMSKNGSLLYHEVITEVDGNGTQIKRTQKELDRIQSIYDSIIMEKSDVTTEMLEEQREKVNDWIIGYEEALKLKLIDGVIEESQ